MSGEVIEGTVEVLCVAWLERERGFGSRPDGYTLHATEEDRARFVAAVAEREAAGSDDPMVAPDEYTQPHGEPYRVRVSAEDAARLAARSAGGIWHFGNWPEPGALVAVRQLPEEDPPTDPAARRARRIENLMRPEFGGYTRAQAEALVADGEQPVYSATEPPQRLYLAFKDGQPIRVTVPEAE